MEDRILVAAFLGDSPPYAARFPRQASLALPHATPTAPALPGSVLPRAESRKPRNRCVSLFWRLPGVHSADAARPGNRRSTDGRRMSHAQPRSPGAATSSSRRYPTLDAVAVHDAREALSRKAQHFGSAMAGAIQSLSRPGRSLPADAHSVCRTQCAAQESCATGGGLALGESPLETHKSVTCSPRGTSPAFAGELDRVCESAPDIGRARSDSRERQSSETFRRS